MKFKELLEMQSTRTDSVEMWAWLIAELKKLEGVVVQVEEVEDKVKGVMKNIFVTKGNAETYPAFVCHTDTVHARHENIEAFCKNGIWYCLNFTENSVEQVGTGGDDKVGIWACYQMLKHLPACKAVFFAFEESGCVGSGGSDFITEFAKDCQYLIQVDRQGNSGIVCTGAGTNIASKSFEAAIGEVGEQFGYKPIHNGGMTDVVTLHKNQQVSVSAVNLECGYYKPHTKQEVINAEDVERVVKFCYAIGTTLTEVYPQVVPKPVYSNNYGNGYNNNYNKGYTTNDKRYNSQSNQKKEETKTEKIEKEISPFETFLIKCYECGQPAVDVFHAKCVEAITGIKRVCLGCKIPLDSNELLCETCELCEMCNTLLVTPTEFDIGICERCIKERFNICRKCKGEMETLLECTEGYHEKCQ